MDKTKGKCFENFRIKVAASILPPLKLRSWETRNLFMHETVERVLDLSLSKVNSFVDIFQKLSSFHATIKPYWNVRVWPCGRLPSVHSTLSGHPSTFGFFLVVEVAT
jgi:hypothetical protein